MQVKLETRASSVNILASYTWANGLTWGGGGINETLQSARFPWNFFGVRTPVLSGYLDSSDPYLSVDKGPGGFDIRHRFSVAYVWDLPFGRNRRFPLHGPLDWVAGGWELSGITYYETGVPDPVAYGIDNLGGAATTRPNLLSNPNNGPRTINQWFDKSAFGAPTPINTVIQNGLNPILAAGNAGRAPIFGPGIQNWDVGVFKNFKLTERVSMQFRTEFFNAFNHPSFSEPDTTYLSPTVGRIFGTSVNAREIQFGLKFLF
jgi:hypothetical protein